MVGDFRKQLADGLSSSGLCIRASRFVISLSAQQRRGQEGVFSFLEANVLVNEDSALEKKPRKTFWLSLFPLVWPRLTGYSANSAPGLMGVPAGGLASPRYPASEWASIVKLRTIELRFATSDLKYISAGTT